MSGRVFVDSNILIYAHDKDAGKKHATAKSVLRKLWDERTGVVSPQVLQEFYVNVTRKIAVPISKAQARQVVEIFTPWCTETTSRQIATAFQIEDEARIGFWDALIIASALKSGAETILSEDLNSRQVIAGIRIENPFTN